VDADSYDFNQGWLFGGRYRAGTAEPGYDDSGFTPVTLPHTVTALSWGDWDPASWQQVWIYRKHFDWPGSTDDAGSAARRVFADFDGVLVSADVRLNGRPVGRHRGGYLPWSAELTGSLAEGGNVLAVIVDARWLPVPPDGAAAGAAAVDFLQPGGIYRDVRLRVVPEVFLSGVSTWPASAVAAGRALQVEATVDAACWPAGPAQVTAELLGREPHEPTVLARATARLTGSPGSRAIRLRLGGLPGVGLWSPDTPRLYTIRTTLSAGGTDRHTVHTSTGFRDAVFRPDGFYLNGQRLPLFGLNRHQLFPYLGMAAPARLQRADAELLRYELNCNMVRCSHYPQSPHFLDACDEIGLMVWAEPPGWQYVGDAAWQDLMLANTADLVTRDRHRPSVIMWGTRLNETASYPALYARSRQLARELDGSRPSTGAMNRHSRAGWAEDVFGYNDYPSQRGRTGLKRPLPGLPYLVSEAVGALAGPPRYRWADPGATLAAQARLHAEVHDIALGQAGCAGLLGWAAIDYASLNGGDRVWHGLKTPGVTDTFRVPKPAAAVYRAQVDPRVRPVILPVFCWDFGPLAAPRGPGRQAMIATNCDRLEIYVGGQHLATGHPDRAAFRHLAYPPVRTDLTVDGAGRPELRIDGYLGRQLVATARMSADTAGDRLDLALADSSIVADGSDATRVTFRATDAYGNLRPQVTGQVTLEVAGPATLIGDNPFRFDRYGPVGGAFLRSQPGLTGEVRVTATHPDLGRATARGTVIPPAAGRAFR